jgi:hypothetical protein
MKEFKYDPNYQHKQRWNESRIGTKLNKNSQNQINMTWEHKIDSSTSNNSKRISEWYKSISERALTNTPKLISSMPLNLMLPLSTSTHSNYSLTYPLPLWHLSTKRQTKEPEGETRQWSDWGHRRRRPKETLCARVESAAARTTVLMAAAGHYCLWR